MQDQINLRKKSNKIGSFKIIKEGNRTDFHDQMKVGNSKVQTNKMVQNY